jgi:pimeloyl-ACP methyl ester carboxylesterase
MNRAREVILSIAVALAFLSIPAAGAEPKVQTGDIDGVPYRIQIPAQWNNGLVMYAHGYKSRGAAWTPLPAVIGTVFLERGFAVAESGYSRQGWAVEEALKETEALRQFFVKTYGKPDSTFIAGHSMGGLITLATIESYPDAYDGALPMCGPLVPALAFFKERVFDMLVTFEAVFGDSLPREYRPVVDVSELPPQVVERALASKPAAAAEFAEHWDTKPGDLPPTVWYYHVMLREIIDRAGGNPVDNRNTVYSGLETTPNINESVPRYVAVPEALSYLRRYYTPTGVIKDPVIAVHTTYDAGVPPSFPSSYAVRAALSGNERLFVQKHVCADGHCKIDPASTGRAFDELRRWAATGVPPEPGLIR